MKVSTLCLVLLIAAGWAKAQTIIPSLDEQGRKGDIARLAQKQAVEKFDDADKNKLAKFPGKKLKPFLTY